MRPAVLGLLLILTTLVGAEPKFVPANDSYPLLRRDLLPLDVDSIRELADHLAILGDGPIPETAAQLRNKVRALTLSQRLSPTQLRTRTILQALSNGETRPSPDKAEFSEAKKGTMKIAQWLIDLPADTEGHLLGQLILDILAPGMENNPMVQRRNLDDEAARWRGVIPNISRFEGAPKITAPLVDRSNQEKKVLNYKTENILTTVPMLVKDIPQKSPVSPKLVKTSLIIKKKHVDPENPEAPQPPLRFRPKTGFDLGPLDLALGNFFAAAGRPLPPDHILNVDTDKLQYVAANKENIAAPLAMMIDAALTGRPLRRNTYFFARLSANGSLKRPHHAWELILHLLKSEVPPGSRLIVGEGLEEEFNALLVIQKAQFFVDYEVIAAPTFEAARELFYEDGDPPQLLSTASEGYAEVREKALEANSLVTFLGLSAVEERLVKARDAFPQHLSSKMLATQAIRRPSVLSDFMLAQELDRRLKPIYNFKFDAEKNTERQIRNLYKNVRESVQPLERLLQLDQKGLYGETLLFIQELNRIARAAGDSFEARAAMEGFSVEMEEFREKLQKLYQYED